MGVKDLVGSSDKDIFKWWHKQIPNTEGWYACDIDLSLLDRNGLLCIEDYKHGNDTITWAEKKVYGDLFERGLPTYIIKNASRTYNNIIRFNKKGLERQLSSLGLSVDVIEAIMETNIEKTLKANAINTMEKSLSVWGYIPDDSKQGYSSKLISNDYIKWEEELRKRRSNV
jgi:hypothetical protein